MKKISVIYQKHSATVDAIKYKLSSMVQVTTINDNDAENCDLAICVGRNVQNVKKAIATHHSLLPAFNTEEPIRDAFLAGVKVTGITFYYTDSYRIIAQYPVFINENMHYDELEQTLLYLEQVLYPLIVEKVINGEPIDIQKLMNTNNNCSGHNCGGCGSCNH